VAQPFPPTFGSHLHFSPPIPVFLFSELGFPLVPLVFALPLSARPATIPPPGNPTFFSFLMCPPFTTGDSSSQLVDRLWFFRPPSLPLWPPSSFQRYPHDHSGCFSCHQRHFSGVRSDALFKFLVSILWHSSSKKSP